MIVVTMVKGAVPVRGVNRMKKKTRNQVKKSLTATTPERKTKTSILMRMEKVDADSTSKRANTLWSMNPRSRP